MKRLDGCYTRLLRKAKGWTFHDRKTNAEVYGDLPRISDVVKRRQVAFAGHCARSTDAPQPIQHLVFWEAPAKFIRGKGATMIYNIPPDDEEPSRDRRRPDEERRYQPPGTLVQHKHVIIKHFLLPRWLKPLTSSSIPSRSL